MSMPAGKYYIGDLCYVMHPEWNEFCNITCEGHTVKDGEFALADGRRFASYCTMYGDGRYPASNGANLGVDAGLIGCILVSDICESELKSLRFGTVVDFTAPFETSEHEGKIRFGHIVVDTNPDMDGDDDYVPEWDDDDED